jgi:hypothetical protein
MKINDLFESQKQLDELSLGGIGRGLAKGVGAVSKGIGAVAGGARGAIDAAKQGYQAGRAAVSGNAQPNTAPATGQTAPNIQTNQGQSAPSSNQTQQTNQTAEPAGNQSSSMANMAGQMKSMAPPETTSTGGQVKQTATGQVNTANPNNPNAQQATAAPTDTWQYQVPGSDSVYDVGTDQSGQLYVSMDGEWDTVTDADDVKAIMDPANRVDAGAQPAAASTQQKAGKVGVPAGKQAVDQAVQTIASVRGDRRPQVVQYAKEKIDALVKQPAPAAAPDLQVQQGGKAQQAAEGFHSRFLGMKI